MLERFRKTVFGDRELGKAVVGSTTTVMLGCETCPNRREAVIHNAGGIVLNGMPTNRNVPIDVSKSYRIRATVVNGTETSMDIEAGVISINQSPCRQPCEFKTEIDKIADRLTSSPAAIQAMVEQEDQEVIIRPMDDE